MHLIWITLMPYRIYRARPSASLSFFSHLHFSDNLPSLHTSGLFSYQKYSQSTMSWCEEYNLGFAANFLIPVFCFLIPAFPTNWKIGSMDLEILDWFAICCQWWLVLRREVHCAYANNVGGSGFICLYFETYLCSDSFPMELFSGQFSDFSTLSRLLRKCFKIAWLI